MKLYKFEATPTILPDGTVTWQLCHFKGPEYYPVCGTTKADFPNVTVPEGAKHQNQPFEFTIMGNTGITFAPNAPPQQGPTSSNPGPIWIFPKGEPNHPGIDPQIEIKGGGGPTKLILNNKNSEPAHLKYQLNFVDSGGKAVTALDPEIVNGGKGFVSYSFTAMELALGMAVLLAIGYFLRPLFRAIFGR